MLLAVGRDDDAGSLLLRIVGGVGFMTDQQYNGDRG